MAKKYSVENISMNPARPIMFTMGKAGKSLGQNAKVASTDGIPLLFTEKEYAVHEAALKRYEEAGMVRIKIIDDKPVVAKRDEPVIKTGAEGDDDELKELRKEASDLGIKSWQTMKKSTLIEAIAKANLEKDTEKDV